MQNHQCAFAKYCDAYIKSRCEGCSRNTQGRPNDMRDDLEFHVGHKVLVKSDLKDGHKGSHLRGKVCTILHVTRMSKTCKVMLSEDPKIIFDESELEHAYVWRDEKELYIKQDIKVTKEAYDSMFRKGICEKAAPLSIKDVIFNDPATIVMWSDGTKTVVKCENEAYDPEKGLAMAIAKKALGNKGNYFNVFKKWLPEDYETPKPLGDSRPWKIWYRHYENGKLIGSGVYIKCYQLKNDATRVARKVYGDTEKYTFIVSMANPWKEA